MSASDESPQAGVTQQVLDTYRGTVSGPVSPYRWCLMTHVSTAVSTSAVTMCHQHQCQCQCGPSWDLMLIMSAWCSSAHARTISHNFGCPNMDGGWWWLGRVKSSPGRGYLHLLPAATADTWAQCSWHGGTRRRGAVLSIVSCDTDSRLTTWTRAMCGH